MTVPPTLLAIVPALLGAAAICAAQSTGTAIYYADSLAGNSIANGDSYDPNEFTAGHKDLHFGASVELTNLNNERTVVVEITDRLPKSSGHLLILSRRAAESLGMIDQGVAPVRLRVLRPHQPAESSVISANHSDYNKPSPFPGKRAAPSGN